MNQLAKIDTINNSCLQEYQLKKELMINTRTVQSGDNNEVVVLTGWL